MTARRLAAMLAADVIGLSRLNAEKEAMMPSRLRVLSADIIRRQNGRRMAAASESVVFRNVTSVLPSDQGAS